MLQTTANKEEKPHASDQAGTKSERKKRKELEKHRANSGQPISMHKSTNKAARIDSHISEPSSKSSHHKQILNLTNAGFGQLIGDRIGFSGNKLEVKVNTRTLS